MEDVVFGLTAAELGVVVGWTMIIVDIVVVGWKLITVDLVVVGCGLEAALLVVGTWIELLVPFQTAGPGKGKAFSPL